MMDRESLDREYRLNSEIALHEIKGRIEDKG